MDRGYIELRLRAAVDAGELLGLLDDEEMIGVWEEEDMLHMYWPLERWNSQTLEAVQEALERLHVRNDAAISIDVLPEQDWNARWAKSVKPVRIGRRVVIRQSWNQVRLSSEGIEIILDPRQAFGTGHHPTTQLVLEWLDERIRGGELVLDVGTGSGILAMVALRLGASSALGIDNDRVALDCAQEYAALNGFGSELELRATGIEELEGGQFDLVLANLDRQVLLQYSDLLVRHLKPEGTIFMSGLQPEDYQEISDAFVHVGGIVRSRKDRDGWLALEISLAFHTDPGSSDNAGGETSL